MGNSGVTGAEPLQHDTAASPVGTYAITAALGTLAAQNYTFGFASGVLSVTPATLTVSANNAGRLYGSSDPAYSDTITGFVLSQTLGNSGVTGAPSLSSGDTAASPVGTYAITAALGTLAAQNYTFGFASGVLSVTPATLTVSANTPAGSTARPTRPTATDHRLRAESDLRRQRRHRASLSSSDTAASSVGTYAITAALGTLAAQNYTFGFASGVLSVGAHRAGGRVQLLERLCALVTPLSPRVCPSTKPVIVSL